MSEFGEKKNPINRFKYKAVFLACKFATYLLFSKKKHETEIEVNNKGIGHMKNKHWIVFICGFQLENKRIRNLMEREKCGGIN